MYDDIVDSLASDDYYQVKRNIDKLINDDKFIKEIVKVHNPLAFDRFIKMCEYKIDTSPLYEERNKFIRKAILSLNEDNICDFFGLYSSDKSRNETIANRYLIEYIVGYYFGDNYYNFVANFYQMINYLDSTNKDLISKNNLDLYKEFVDLRNMSFVDKISFFKLLLDDLDIMKMFYDDMNIVKEDSHKKLVDKVIKLNHESEIYEESMSRKFGVDVYYLDGEKFYGFVRCLSLKRDELDDNGEYVFAQQERLGYSFSYISHNNIGTSDYSRKDVALFYDDIDYHNIMYVHHGDMHSKKMVKQDDYVSNKENEIMTPDNLIARTNNYNEIYIKKGKDGIKPKALICYDRITLADIAFAEKYGIAILLINTRKYHSYETYEDDYDSYSYSL